MIFVIYEAIINIRLKKESSVDIIQQIHDAYIADPNHAPHVI